MYAYGVQVVNNTYNYSSTQNNGKITSQTDNITGEQVVYAYDSLNRLASAGATSSSWGQSYGYDGFGNLSTQTVTAGSAPAYSVVPDPATNHVGSTDYNGNSTAQINGQNPYYDVQNRLVAVGTGNVQYSYAPGNKRVWRGIWTSGSLSTDEITFWSISGQKLATYSLQVLGGLINSSPATPQLVATQATTNYYFGGKLIKNANGYVGADRLGSIGKYYPYGQEKPSATTNGTEKFTGYMRDAETGLDYADQRYHNPGTGRFQTVDLGMPNPRDPGSWNRYAYAVGDPANSRDPDGRTTRTPPPPTCDPADPTCAQSCDPVNDLLCWVTGGGSSDPCIQGNPFAPGPPPMPCSSGAGADPDPAPAPKVTTECQVQLLGQSIITDGVPFDHTVVQVSLRIFVDGVLNSDTTNTWEGVSAHKDETSNISTSFGCIVLDGCWLNEFHGSAGATAYPGMSTLTALYSTGYSASNCGFATDVNAAGLAARSSDGKITYELLGPNSNSFTYTLLRNAGAPSSWFSLNPLFYPGWGIYLGGPTL